LHQIPLNSWEMQHEAARKDVNITAFIHLVEKTKHSY